MLAEQKPISVPQEMAPQLIIVVDTEEEFDWDAPPDPSANSVTAINELGLAQEIFDDYDIRPCYVVDYPVAATASSVQVLKAIFDTGRCEIGTHLHPWVNPPHDEEMTRSNMYPGNLSRDLERQKLMRLSEAIESSFGARSRVYKAGRYGVGPNTSSLLEEFEYDVDLSFCPAFDYSGDGGPDFSRIDASPFWFGRSHRMLEIPLSGAFAGIAGGFSSRLHKAAGKLPAMKLRGVLSRLGIVDRLMLSPEGYTSAEHIKLTRFLFNCGVRTFTWNFHSSSLLPGMTMYTRNEAERSRFLDSFRRYFDFFLNEFGGEATTPLRLRKTLEQIK